ncbi:hypothetical protein DdX_07253 [Ditylenchus destructor]|uniref:Uncharacterized protein n=1 Tax=Ditylenchus destructor TaxID=166010 RepID=A0AAD4N624_9BILA|nr:hypothetical protein DdX_07253 [Ditylenchus destructor]
MHFGAMGCLLARICDPALPDASVRNFWHVGGVIIDAASSGAPQNNSRTRTGSMSLEVSSTTNAGGNNSSRHSSGTLSIAKLNSIQKRPAGVLYVYNGRLTYKSRRCSLSRNAKPLQFEMCDILDVHCSNNFTSHKDGKKYSGNVVEIIVTTGNKGSSTLHIGFFTNQAEEVSRALGETCVKHRQKPKIFQFNSVDVDGVEIDLP